MLDLWGALGLLTPTISTAPTVAGAGSLSPIMMDWTPLQILDLPTVKTMARSLVTLTGTLERSITWTGTLNTTRLELEVAFLVAESVNRTTSCFL